MYICNCNGLRRACVQAAIAAGAPDPTAIYAHHGCRMRCGRCLPEMLSALMEAGAAAAAPAPLDLVEA